MNRFPPSIQRVAIIGAGPSGVSAAKFLLAEKAFEKIDVFEQRDDVGGVWNHTSNKAAIKTSVPQLDPNYNPSSLSVDSLLETPMYDFLETNIPRHLMQFANRPFDASLPLFPSRESVLAYCKRYAEDVRALIHFNTQVTEVRQVRDEVDEQAGATYWAVTVTRATQEKVRKYDAVVVASGHYTVPFIPAIPGIETWSSAYPGTVMHSKAYRSQNIFVDKKVIVVGSAASGIDIGSQIAKVCKPYLLLSSRTENTFFPRAVPMDDVPEIAEFLDPKQHDRAVRFSNGRIESEIDYVLFATGYLYSYPFLKLVPSVITDGLRTRDVYQQIFHIQHPTLAFPGLSQKVIPFPLSENQAAVIARVWSGRLQLPTEQQMRTAEKKMLDERGDTKAMHVLNFPEDADYMNMLYDSAATATPSPRLENGGIGLMGTRWDNKQRWMRSHFPAIKGAYAAKGEERSKITTIEEFGFDYQHWKKANDGNVTDSSSSEPHSTENR